MIHERAALSWALLNSHIALCPKRLLWTFIPPRHRAFDSDTLIYLRERIDELRQVRRDADPSRAAFLSVLIVDLESLERSVTGLSGPAREFDAARLIREYTSYAERYLKEGLELPWHEVATFIHERYPEPMAWQDTYAFTAMQPISDQIGAGIHYRRDHLFPALVRIATLHENVHVATEGRGSYRVFDNGIADFLAFVIHCHATSDVRSIQRYREYLAEVSPTLTEYPKYCQAIGALVLQVGLGGFLQLVRRRMQDPESIEWDALYSAISSVSPDLPDLIGPIDGRMPSMVNELEPVARRIAALLAYPESYIVVSPASFLFLRTLRAEGHARIEELSARFGFNITQALEIRDELIDWRLVHNAGADGSHLLYLRPSDELKPSNTSAMLGPRALRVAPSAGAPEVADLARDVRLYATAWVGRGADGPSEN